MVLPRPPAKTEDEGMEDGRGEGEGEAEGPGQAAAKVARTFYPKDPHCRLPKVGQWGCAGCCSGCWHAGRLLSQHRGAAGLAAESGLWRGSGGIQDSGTHHPWHPLPPTAVQAYVTEKDKLAVRRVNDKGLYLLGFKPLGTLRDHHQIRSAKFVYPGVWLLGPRGVGAGGTDATVRVPALIGEISAQCAVTPVGMPMRASSARLGVWSVKWHNAPCLPPCLCLPAVPLLQTSAT